MFTHLHLHTEFSLLDGACRMGRIAKRAKELGMTSLAITDHGNMYGAVDFYRACKNEGIKPIIGCEVYVAPRTRFDRDKGLDKEYSHLILLCKNEQGYKNLIKMVSLSYTQGFYFKPRIDESLLEKYHDGLICLSACMSGAVQKAIIQRDASRAREIALWYNNLFGRGNYYLELQDHGIREQKMINEGLKSISREENIPLVATNDVHYEKQEDSKIQQVLICIATNRTLGEKSGMDFDSDEFYLKSEEQMTALFPDTPEAIENTQKIADMCNFDFEFGNTKLPFFETPNGMDHFEYLKSLCSEGMAKRYGENPPKEYTDRLNYELETVNSMGYTDYYLIVVDFVMYAKNHGIPVGPGRGSGAGSIAAYCIGITDIDPMKYDLIFERFLNPERVSMPDFDIDFCYERRQEVIDYVTRKYGADHVAQIVTFGTLQTRAAIRDVGRVMGMPYSAVDNVAKLVPKDFHISIDSAVKRSKDLRALMERDSDVNTLIETARKIEGMPRNTSTHAAGVVITHDAVSSYVPLATNDNVVVTQYIMTTLEELGLLKMDFLGLRTLTVINDAATAAGIDIESIDIDDQNVYKLFSKGQTDGIFQFESSGMKDMLQKLKPNKLEHLIAATSLYRPGPADQIDGYVACANNPSLIRYKTPLLKPILENTFGFMVYQEQVMQIFRTLAGYSFGQADVVRRAMSKKKHDVMERERIHFVDGAVKNGVDKKAADDIFNDMAGFASYAFNKSHAACYALVAYRTAYLKVYAPAEFMAALLTSVLDRPTKVALYIAESKRMGLKLSVPDINKSMGGFTADGKVITYGLLGIKNLGSDFISDIISERKENGEFKSFFDFCSRLCDKHFNRRGAESLIMCGALDNLGSNRRQMLQALPSLASNLDEYRNRLKYGQVGFFELKGDESFGRDFEMPQVDDFAPAERLKMEKEMTGLYLSGHPCDKYSAVVEQLCIPGTAEVLEAGQGGISPFDDKSFVMLCGIITNVTVKKTKAGATMAFVTLEDVMGAVEIVVFPKTMQTYSALIYEGSIITVSGTISLEEDKDAKVLANVITGPPKKTDKPFTVKPNRQGYSNNNSQQKAGVNEPKSSTKTSSAVIRNTANGQDKDTSSPQNKTGKKRRVGLFLRLNSQDDDRVKKTEIVTSIFEGSIPLYYYYKDTAKYHHCPVAQSVEVNDTMLRELKRILGDENVVYIPPEE